MPTTLRLPQLAVGVACGLALLVTTLADGPRTAVLVALLAGAIALTRVRYAPIVMLAVLVLMAAVALSGNGPGEDPRPTAAPRAAGG